MGLAGLKVMLVEDHGFQRRLGLRLLSDLGLSGLHEAADGFQGEVKVLTSCPSCLQGLERYDDDADTSADYVVIEIARHPVDGQDMVGLFPARIAARGNHGHCSALPKPQDAGNPAANQ